MSRVLRVYRDEAGRADPRSPKRWLEIQAYDRNGSAKGFPAMRYSLGSEALCLEHCQEMNDTRSNDQRDYHLDTYVWYSTTEACYIP